MNYNTIKHNTPSLSLALYMYTTHECTTYDNNNDSCNSNSNNNKWLWSCETARQTRDTGEFDKLINAWHSLGWFELCSNSLNVCECVYAVLLSLSNWTLNKLMPDRYNWCVWIEMESVWFAKNVNKWCTVCMPVSTRYSLSYTSILFIPIHLFTSWNEMTSHKPPREFGAIRGCGGRDEE